MVRFHQRFLTWCKFVGFDKCSEALSVWVVQCLSFIRTVICILMFAKIASSLFHWHIFSVFSKCNVDIDLEIINVIIHIFFICISFCFFLNFAMFWLNFRVVGVYSCASLYFAMFWLNSEFLALIHVPIYILPVLCLVNKHILPKDHVDIFKTHGYHGCVNINFHYAGHISRRNLLLAGLSQYIGRQNPTK